MPTDISSDFAAFAARTKYADLRPEVVGAAKKSILDTLGVMMAASGIEPAVKPGADLAKEMGGQGESTILGFGGKVPAIMAAFVNGSMAHCLDFDDHAPEGHHPSSSIVPTAFALAERKGGISGRDLITAVAVGQDMFLRLRRNVGWRQDWHLTTVVGVFSAAAAGGHVLGFNEQQYVDAFGIAGAQSSGTMELGYGVGSDLRALYAGFISKSSVLSALLAEKGIRGTPSIFEGKAGFFNVYFGGVYDRDKMLDGLGRDFGGPSIMFKPYPSCGASHPYIHATIELMKENSLGIDDIQEIRVYVGDFQNHLCEPLEQRRHPKTFADAKFSIPFCVAIAAARGTVQVADFTGTGLNAADVLAAAEKVVPVRDSNFDWKLTLPDGKVEIVTKDGRTLMGAGGDLPGGTHAPMTWDSLDTKFQQCVAYAANKPSPETISKAQELIHNLEKLDDATEVMRVLTK